MQAIINGTQRQLEDGTTVASLLDGLKLAPVRVAVEINEDLVPRKTFGDTLIRPGDRVEIVTFVGGG